MSFSAGNRVRFSATFRDVEQRAFDPVAVAVTITSGGKIRQLTRAAGEVKRMAIGQFYVDVLLDAAGPVDVRFASTGDGQEGWLSTRYDVAADNQVFHVEQHLDDRFDDSEDEPSDRDQMVDELEASGVRARGRSDAYVEAAYRAMTPESSRDAYLRKRRSR